MPRPLTGKVTQARNGRWIVEVPQRKGGKSRVQRRFDTFDEADAWRLEALKALETGEPLPDVQPSKVEEVLTNSGSVVPSTEGRTEFELVAYEWLASYYGGYRMAQGDRAHEVRRYFENHLFPFLRDTGVACGSELTFAHFEELQFRLVGRDAAAPSAGSELVAEERWVRLTEATATYLVDRNTLRRYVQSGRLDQRRDDSGRILINLAQLEGAGVSTTKPLRRGPRSTGSKGIGVETANDIVWALRKALRYGANKHGWQLRFDPSSMPNLRETDRTRAQDRDPVTLSQMEQIARLMHPVHQVVLLLLRILGLRISEAYGIRLRDLRRCELKNGTEVWVIRVRAQGGRTFLEPYKSDGSPQERKEGKQRTKTADSDRSLIVPRQLAHVLAVYLQVFHPEFNPDARLIRGLRHDDRGGQGAFRSALAGAVAKIGIDLTSEPDGTAEGLLLAPTPHSMRASITSDMQDAGVDAVAARRMVGHIPGDDVHARHYLLNSSLEAAYQKVIASLEQLIDAELSHGLLIPTTVPCTTASQPALAADAARIEAELREVGWLVDEAAEDGWIDSSEIAALYGVAESAARRWLREGKWTTRIRGSKGAAGQERLALATDVIADLKVQRSRITISSIAEEFGLGYHRVHELYRLQVNPEHQTGSGSISLTAEEAEQLRLLASAEVADAALGMTSKEAADRLGVSARVLDVLVVEGELAVVAGRRPGQRRLITHASLEQFEQGRVRQDRQRRRRLPAR